MHHSSGLNLCNSIIQWSESSCVVVFLLGFLFPFSLCTNLCSWRKESNDRLIVPSNIPECTDHSVGSDQLCSIHHRNVFAWAELLHQLLHYNLNVDPTIVLSFCMAMLVKFFLGNIISPLCSTLLLSPHQLCSIHHRNVPWLHFA